MLQNWVAKWRARITTAIYNFLSYFQKSHAVSDSQHIAIQQMSKFDHVDEQQTDDWWNVFRDERDAKWT